MSFSKNILLIFVLLGSILFAQNSFSNLSVTKLTPDDGLSQGSNYYRYEDQLGFVWITGNDAINRYDGNYIKVYKKDFYFENCKNLQQGYGFAEDDQHNIYIGSTNGLYIYRRKKDKFNVRFLLPKGKDQTIFPIGFDDGKIWCHNKNFDIISYDVKRNATKVFVTSGSYRVSSFHIYDNRENPIFRRIPFLDNHKNVWIVNPNGLLLFDTKNNTTYRYLEDYLSKYNFKILSSSYDKYANLILIGINDGLLVFDCKTKTFERKIKSSNIENIANNKTKIALRNRDYFEIYDRNFNLTFRQRLDDNLVTSYCYSFDRMDRFWMCRDGFGQVIIDFKPALLNKVAGTTKFIQQGVGGFAEFGDGNILVQNEIVFNKEKFSFGNVKLSDNSTAIYIQNVSDIKNGIVWQFVQKRDEPFDLFQITKDKKQHFFCKFSNIRKIGLMQDAILLKNKLLCSFQSGLYLIDIKTKSIKKLNHQNKINAFKINPISGNRILVSYLNQEATLYQLNNKNKITSSKNILNGYQAFYFQEDTIKNMIWCGTNNGVLVLDRNLKIIKKIDANNNLAGTYIYGLLLDEEGNCWTSHQRGLSYINAENYNIINFTREDGIQDWDFNNRAYYKSVDGTLFFGGMKGFNYFKPPLKYDNKIYQSKVYIDEILINQKRIKSNINNDYINELTVNPNDNNISIHAIVRNIYKGKQSPIIYRINHSGWIYKTSDCIIDLVNLAPDNYKLELGIYDKFENKTIVQKTLFITISAPFYYKIWFWIFITFLFAGFVFWLLNRRKFARQKNIFEQQLALEQQRNKITADLHDDLGATLSSLQINSVIAHQLMNKNPKQAQIILEKIEHQSQNLADKIGDIIWSMKSSKDQFMTMSTRIKTFANDILSATDINYSIDIENKIDDLVKDITTRKNIVLIIKEAINNTVKYSKGKELKINMTEKNNLICIVISDNGIGCENLETKGNGIGNMKKRANELNGQFDIISVPNLGTTITVHIPVVP